MRAIILATALLLDSGAAALSLPQPRIVLKEDFERGGGVVAKALAGDKRLTIDKRRGVNGSAALRADYVGGTMGSERLVRGVPFGEEGSAYTLFYYVRFDKEFQFVRGGKLLGIGPARPVTGGDPMRPDGWSARVMWRTDGRPELYVYHQDQKGRYGDHGVIVNHMRFAPGKWHGVALQVKVNTPGEADGMVRLYVDGQLVEYMEKVRLRGTGAPGTLASQFLFHTFHGGNDPSWAPRKLNRKYATVHAWFDNIVVDMTPSVQPRHSH